MITFAATVAVSTNWFIQFPLCRIIEYGRNFTHNLHKLLNMHKRWINNKKVGIKIYLHSKHEEIFNVCKSPYLVYVKNTIFVSKQIHFENGNAKWDVVLLYILIANTQIPIKKQLTWNRTMLWKNFNLCVLSTSIKIVFL